MIVSAALGEVPALPLHTAGRYVAGAYVVLFTLVLIYVAIMAIRLSRIERELGELLSMPEGSSAPAAGVAEQDAPRESTPAYPIKGHM